MVGLGGPGVLGGTATPEERGEGERPGTRGREHGGQAGGREAGVGCMRGLLRGFWAPTEAAQACFVEVGVQRHERGHEDHQGDQVCAAKQQNERIIPCATHLNR